MDCKKCGATEANLIIQHDVVLMDDYIICIKCGMRYFKDGPKLKDLKPIQRKNGGKK